MDNVSPKYYQYTQRISLAEVFDKAISCELFWARRFLSTLNLRILFEK